MSRSLLGARRVAGLVLAAALLPAVLAAPRAEGSDASADGSREPVLYFVILDHTPLARAAPRNWSPAALRAASAAQEGALAAARSLGGEIRFRYTRAINGFSAVLEPAAAARLARAPGVVRVEPVARVERAIDRSVPLIGAPEVWAEYGKKGRGKGVHVAVVDSGIDYTHAAFGGPGTTSAYDDNDPTAIEPGSFPTGKVVAGRDFVGDDYNVLDNKTGNDTPMPDPDPLDPQGHGTHVAHTCCGKNLAGVGRGVAPKAKLHAYKVWGKGGSSTADVLVAAYELAVDPDQDGFLSDHVDVLNFSGGVFYGTAGSTESVSAQSLVNAGVVFVAAAGNSGGRPYRVGAPATAPGVLSVAATEVPSDRIAGFSSGGPARAGAALKPEISAPGDPIWAAKVGTGDGATVLSGTSMATPHVAGSAALIAGLHPGWTPAMVKASLMNHATRKVRGGGSEPAPAILMGAGRIRVGRSAAAVSLALPGSVSFGVMHAGTQTSVDSAFVVMNRDGRAHRYTLTGSMSHTNLGPGALDALMSIDGDPYLSEISFRLQPEEQKVVDTRLIFEPSLVPLAAELLPRQGELPVGDGFFKIRQLGGTRDTLKVPWLAVPHVSAAVAPSQTSLDLTSGNATIGFDVTPTSGTSAADVYSLGVSDPSGDVAAGEADITHVGVRSFAGSSLGDGPEGLPTSVDASGQEWLESLTSQGFEEPIEFVVRTAAPHDTIETLDITISVDLGADGIFADGSGADRTIEKPVLQASGCVRDLSGAGDCLGSFGLDYDRFDSGLIGIVVDSFELGLEEGDSAFSYRVEVCSDSFSGDVAAPICDETAGIAGSTYPARFDATEQAPLLERSFCGGFYSTTDCRAGIEVSGSPGDPSLLLAFPNNPPGSDAAVLSFP